MNTKYNPNQLHLTVRALMRQLGHKELANMSGTVGLTSVYVPDRMTRREATERLALKLATEAKFCDHEFVELGNTPNRKRALVNMHRAVQEIVMALPPGPGEDLTFHAYTISATLTLEVSVSCVAPDPEREGEGYGIKHYLLKAAQMRLSEARNLESHLVGLKHLRAEAAPLQPMKHEDAHVIAHFGFTDEEWDAMTGETRGKLVCIHRDATERED